MFPLGQTLESRFTIVKVLSVLEVCPQGCKFLIVMAIVTILLLVSVD